MFVIGAIIFCLLPVCSCLIILATVFPEALGHVMVIRANDYAIMRLLHFIGFKPQKHVACKLTLSYVSVERQILQNKK